MAELQKVYRETKDELDSEKRKIMFILQKGQKNVEQLQQERDMLKAHMQRLEQHLAEREQQVLQEVRASLPPFLAPV
jgi:DNA-binding PadR family transcriptional regulator